MTSKKQVEANRANAKGSTGPKTVAGKARSRMNSRKHGLTAEIIVVGDEDASDFSDLREALMEQYDPQTIMECELVERLAGLMWRLRRLPVFEAGVLDFRVEQAAEQERKHQEADRQQRDLLRHFVAKAKGEEVEEEGADGDEDEDEGGALFQSSARLGGALTNDMAFTNSLGKLGRYETMLMTGLARTHQMLLDLQCSRYRAEGPAVEETEVSPTRLRAA